MARLIDRVLNSDWMPHRLVGGHPTAFSRWTQLTGQLRANLAVANVFVIDNVSKWYFEAPDNCKTWVLTRDFPNVAPPYPVMWMEHKPPKYVMERPSVSGKLSRNPEELKLMDKMPMQLTDTQGRCSPTGVLILSRDTGTGWESEYYVFIEHHDGTIIAPWGMEQIVSDKQGKPLYTNPMTFGERVIDEHDQEFHATQLMCVPFMLAVSFLHCKNVTLINNEPSAALNKKYRKKTNKNLITYKTLEIEPMRKVLRTEGKMDTHGIQHALHLCRGHFKHFEDKGLFGKYKGMYWWESHVRGTDRERLVEKEYSVNPPKDKAA